MKRIIKAIAIILCVTLIITGGVIFAFYSPNLYAENVAIPQKVKNVPVYLPVNAPKDESYDADIYVSTDGNDENGNGSLNSPFLTIERAKKAANAIKNRLNRDVIVSIRQGTYSVSE